jgi:hypothetical protein
MLSHINIPVIDSATIVDSYVVLSSEESKRQTVLRSLITRFWVVAARFQPYTLAINYMRPKCGEFGRFSVGLEALDPALVKICNKEISGSLVNS